MCRLVFGAVCAAALMTVATSSVLAASEEASRANEDVQWVESAYCSGRKMQRET